jgi:uncharacterized protein (UPF0332 family)
LKKVFGLENKEIFDAKTERVDKQYYVDFIITKEDVEDTIKKAEVFNSKMIDFIYKLNNEDIKRYRKLFNDVVEAEKNL